MSRFGTQLRCCVATRKFLPKEKLFRVVRTPDNQVYLDQTNQAPGRGAYICKTDKCISQAQKKRSLERALRTNVPQTIYTLLYEEAKLLPKASSCMHSED